MSEPGETALVITQQYMKIIVSEEIANVCPSFVGAAIEARCKNSDYCEPLWREINALGEKYRELLRVTEAKKVALIGENGTLPSPDAIHAERVGWASFMTWSRVFCLTEEFNAYDALKAVYASPYAVTKSRLPVLY